MQTLRFNNARSYYLIVMNVAMAAKNHNWLFVTRNSHYPINIYICGRNKKSNDIHL